MNKQEVIDAAVEAAYACAVATQVAKDAARDVLHLAYEAESIWGRAFHPVHEYTHRPKRVRAARRTPEECWKRFKLKPGLAYDAEIKHNKRHVQMCRVRLTQGVVQWKRDQLQWNDVPLHSDIFRLCKNAMHLRCKQQVSLKIMQRNGERHATE